MDKAEAANEIISDLARVLSCSFLKFNNWSETTTLDKVSGFHTFLEPSFDLTVSSSQNLCQVSLRLLLIEFFC